MAYSSCSNGVGNKILSGGEMGRTSGEIQCDQLSIHSWDPGASGGGPHGSSLLEEAIQPLQCLGRPQWENAHLKRENGAPNTTHSQTKNEIRHFSFWGVGGIVPFEPFFHAFPEVGGKRNQ
ncbi:hypothetical protein C4D60_Mb00t17410 [Musa balbisiana]|uniref:Uncharacterized protein n=1 Tax=Musa balbisiana TaxID=52838 RepID=A0A4S8I3J8_MUSBA|nr:hypothetical protein C4D60_Mb00t17410 [Musa balbisiana]